MKTESATLEKIGEKLLRALEKSEKAPREVLAQVKNPDGTTPALSNWYRWVDGEQEAGCTVMTQLGLALGLRPDSLLLTESGDDVLTTEDEVALSQIRTLIGELSKVFRGPTRPADAIVTMLRDLLKMANERVAEAAGVPSAKQELPSAEDVGRKLLRPRSVSALPEQPQKREAGEDDRPDYGKGKRPKK